MAIKFPSNLWLRAVSFLCVLCVYGFGQTLPLYAEDVSEQSSVNLESLLTEGLKNNRDIKAAYESFEAAKKRVPQASSLPDPTAGTAYMGSMLETSLGPQKNIYEFEQMIPFPGKLVEKRQMATADVKAVEAQLKQTGRDTILKISQTYHDLFAIDETIAVVEETKELLKKVESIASSRYASQGSSQRDVAKAQAEVSDTLQRLFILRQQRNTLKAMLNSLLNRPPNSTIESLSKTPIPSLLSTLDELLDLAKKNRPELQQASAMLKREQHASTLAKYSNAPDFSVGLQYIEIGKGTTTSIDDGKDAWMIPIKVTIPLWQNRIGSEIQEARRNLNASQAKSDQSQNQSEFEVRDAYYRFTSSKQVVELYENALLPETELAFHSDQAGYEAGRIDILNFLDSERVYLNAKIAYFQAQADALKNFAALERAVGTNIPSGENK